MAIKKIKFISAGNLTALADKINSHLEQDWDIYGQVIKTNNEFIQAMYVPHTANPRNPNVSRAKK